MGGYLINFWIKDKPDRFRKIFFIVLFMVFILDHRYYVDRSAPPSVAYPYKLYKTIKKDPLPVTVLEIPFTVRDGFTYFGDGDAFQMIIGESIHQKPVLGGYTGRIADYKKAYYQNNPFLGFIGRVIDSDLINNPRLDKNDLGRWQIINIKESKKTIDFLDLKYIITNDERKYTATLSAVLNDLGFAKIGKDKFYSLWKREPDKREFLNVVMDDPSSVIQLGFGWYLPENNFRWADRRSSLMFKVNKKRRMTLKFSGASFYKNQPVTIFLNKEKVGKINMTTAVKDYSLKMDRALNQGINTIYFIFEKSYRPAEVFENNLDRRQLGGKFTKVFLSEG